MAHKPVGEESDRSAGNAAPRGPRFPYLHSILRQVVLCALLAPLLYALAGADIALSLLCGAACAVVPQAWFALRMQRARGQRAGQAARTGMAAEGGKFLLSAAAFAAVFAGVQPPLPLLVFAGYGALWLVQLGDSVRLLRQPQR